MLKYENFKQSDKYTGGPHKQYTTKHSDSLCNLYISMRKICGLKKNNYSFFIITTFKLKRPFNFLIILFFQ